MSDVEGGLGARAESDGVESFFAMFADMHGKSCAKMVPAEALDVLIGGGADITGFAAGPKSRPGEPNVATCLRCQPGRSLAAVSSSRRRACCTRRASLLLT